MISIDFKIDNKVVATFTVNTDETTVQATGKEQPNTDTATAIPPIDWQKVKEFVEENNIPLTEQESGVLDFYIKWGKVSQNQARVLNYVLKKVQERGFKPSYLF